ncbi:hypothetical protein [Psychroserpens sp.]|uniref:hypothetical protein n=1 Tax=Psychroserpens sp. TaxID=2020870 RepID=UPI001B2AED6B|nr:hypothetical protein [Psychroserpens sp.]MBO6605351.1 hypothetical protein [Psychroserpens sp.]MBO6629966.1 hypothetical protein [Psychroserpens sp.]MBO6653840.1 hypothetical protein [Psychroserpens sp.]MBO6682161.1 hypothetical protein [Psychroserpens sp.]MBO6748725.1 hypothetical protein [Psychroserpens sp.]
MKRIKLLSVFLFSVCALVFTSCSDDDSSGGTACITLVDQPVQGSFRGDAFVSPAGFFKILTFGSETTYRGEIYVKEDIDDDCFFPFFDGTQDNILFPLPSLEPQTITLSDTGVNTLNFNRIVNGVTEVELAECGTITITSYDEANGILEGTVVARGQEGSTVNGNFTLLLCEF